MWPCLSGVSSNMIGKAAVATDVKKRGTPRARLEWMPMSKMSSNERRLARLEGCLCRRCNPKGWPFSRGWFPLPLEPHLAHVPADRLLAGIRQQYHECVRGILLRQGV